MKISKILVTKTLRINEATDKKITLHLKRILYLIRKFGNQWNERKLFVWNIEHLCCSTNWQSGRFNENIATISKIYSFNVSKSNWHGRLFALLIFSDFRRILEIVNCLVLIYLQTQSQNHETLLYTIEFHK